MASADFSLRPAASPFQARGEISPGMTHLPSRLCLSDIRRVVPCKYWALAFMAASPRHVASYPLLVHQASVLPRASFRRPVTRSPLPLANPSPCRVDRGLSPPSRCALPGAPRKNPNRERLGFCYWWWEGTPHQTTIESTRYRRCWQVAKPLRTSRKAGVDCRIVDLQAGFPAMLVAGNGHSNSSAFRGQFNSRNGNRTRVRKAR